VSALTEQIKNNGIYSASRVSQKLNNPDSNFVRKMLEQ